MRSRTQKRRAGVEIRKHLLFGGLSEAITNVSQHAYPETTKHHLQRWWMSAAYQADTDTVIVTFCDHGMTIPGTLPASKFFEKIKDNFWRWHDGEKIRAAMELGRSSTGEPGRGRGLQNFLEIIKEHRGSSLRIYSNHGVLSVTNTGAGGLSFDSKTVQTSLRGTLIEWQFVPKEYHR